MIQRHPMHTPDAKVLGGGEMQRDMDLVRSILLKIDEASEPITMDALLASEPTKEERARLDYHLQMLVKQAGFLSGEDFGSYDGDDWLDLNLTWSGHEFLDSIRDPGIWRETKEGARKVGNWSLKTLADVAVGIAKARVEHLFATGEIGG